MIDEDELKQLREKSAVDNAAFERKAFEFWKKDPDRAWHRRYWYAALPVFVAVAILAAIFRNADPFPSFMMVPFFPLALLSLDKDFLPLAIVVLAVVYFLIAIELITFVARRLHGPKPFQQTYCVKAFHNQLHFDYFAKGLTDDAVDLDSEIKRMLAVYKFHAADATGARQQILELEDQINFHVFKTVKDKLWPHPFSLKLVHFDTDTTKPKAETHADSQPRNVIILS